MTRHFTPEDLTQAANDDVVLKAIGQAALGAYLEAQDNNTGAWRVLENEIERVLNVAAHAYHMPQREA